MRKLILTTAAMIAVAVVGTLWLSERGNKLIPEPISETYDTFTDYRDGKTYKIVTIDGKWWMAENINYQTKSGSWCYGDCKQYGRLYDWNTARTVCPNGWTLPSREDWDYLGQAVGGERKSNRGDGTIDWYGAGKKLKARSGWRHNMKYWSSGNGTDDFGFSALPGGHRYNDGSIGTAGDDGYWWTASEDSDGYAYYRYMYYYFDYVSEGYSDKSVGRSVRCVADRP
jgi:uncharacterized protein (TIGR02145 family)